MIGKIKVNRCLEGIAGKGKVPWTTSVGREGKGELRREWKDSMCSFHKEARSASKQKRSKNETVGRVDD